MAPLTVRTSRFNQHLAYINGRQRQNLEEN